MGRTVAYCPGCAYMSNSAWLAVHAVGTFQAVGGLLPVGTLVIDDTLLAIDAFWTAAACLAVGAPLTVRVHGCVDLSQPVVAWSSRTVQGVLQWLCTVQQIEHALSLIHD